ncbi:ketopantoate reductase family protein [Pseudonocardia kunmingensis]|uniref:2-dehydropantoate 2-reductase n=1 Tax=Pseudonocardia kunmingensis TaxID=630975 RepID=A0A543DR59_9PSEU|nr:2-dehydropantoate 2-reductase [Pseudonocardia kunmingensis]TQM11825.1 2-dehydropantoate 2-reductase [Pseudonocardia kunmingensis]
MSKVAIVGCGAMGSVYAGLMQRAGHEVHGVCLWPDHVEAVNARGLRVHGASGDQTVRLASMSTTTEGIGVCDLVVIATKAFDVAAAAESARPLVGPATVVQSIQNGLGSPERVAAVLGGERLAIGVVGGFGASVPAPGVAHHNGMEMIRFGAFAGLPRDALEASAQVWTSSGFAVQLFEDTDRMVWEKFVMNVAFSGTTCVTGLTIGQVLADPSAWAVAEACAREALAVADAAGIALDVGDPIAHVRALGGKIPDARPSMLLDFLLRRRGEVDAIVGQVTVLGERYGVATPVTRTVADLIRARESGYLPGAEA